MVYILESRHKQIQKKRGRERERERDREIEREREREREREKESKKERQRHERDKKSAQMKKLTFENKQPTLNIFKGNFFVTSIIIILGG